MKASDLHRGLPQYKELYEIDHKDEFLHCFAYELAIRSIKDRLEREFEGFYIKDNEIGLKTEELENIAKEINPKNIRSEYIEIVEDIAKRENITPVQKAILYKLEKLEDDIRFDLGINLVDLHIEYTFFSEHFKKIFYSFTGEAKHLFLDKSLYNGTMESIAYFNTNFVRTYIFSPKMPNDEFRDVRTHYTLRYKRPMFHSTILSNNKKADVTINADLPKKIIMQQLEKLVDIIKADKKNILSNKDKVALADGISNYEMYANELYDNKRLYIDALIIFDYVELRSKEIEIANKEKEQIKRQKIDYINKSIEMLKDEKREQIKQINIMYKKHTLKEVKIEIGQTLGLGYETVEKYRKTIASLIKEKNFLKLIEGKDIQSFNL